ncbi:hypothetical protein Poli38472_002704 [Pythium oligandrum]|uniref:Kinesin motor domain-containing protein n=1 Tax=Pythium oligandrum TaxID=41045 RepID=A0A8K1FML0_PYTOL|nr:hypothetical protein Poli38472_002704 [Pythium oligandrum]|eukprot:TMW63763.1 hypothetical protein Poli38472_002704 [Pythium oligandrum]
MSRLQPPTSRRSLRAPTVHASSSSSFVNTNGSGIPQPGRRTASSIMPPQPGLRAPSMSSRGLGNNQLQHRYSKSVVDDDAQSVRSAHSDDGTRSVKSRTSSMGSQQILSSLQSTSLSSPPAKPDDNIRVLIRIRPPRSKSYGGDLDDYPEDDNQYSASAGRRCLDITNNGHGLSFAPGSAQEKRFAFDRVFEDYCSQEDIFQDSGLMAVENAINGFNGCIFAYGQTGSGKTFTMLGGSGEYDPHELKVSPLRGLMPRIFDHLFRRLEGIVADDSNDLEYSLSCSYLEIYNEKIFDLLEDGGFATQQPKSLREDSKKEVYVDQLRQVTITSAAEAIEWLHVGSKNRRMASTDMNRESSRSHAVFTIRLVQTHHTERGVLVTRRSNLHLVDLAGSEKQRQTKAAGQRLKEAAQINKSLSALGNVIMALVDVSNGLKRHVHYRDSKLTFLLRDSLGGNSITTIIATISAEEKFFSETLSTLKFAQRAKFIKNKAVQNEDSDAMVPMLKQEIERLRQEIAELKRSGPPVGDRLSETSNHYDNADRYSDRYSYQDRNSYVSQHSQPEEKKRENRWEPALEVMERLLSASGAAPPEDGNEDIYALEGRCQRLEMLLYRMICRYEEHKVMSYSVKRNQPSAPRPSLLRKPKIRYRGGTDDTASEDSYNGNNPELEQELADQFLRSAELERENNLMRQQLVEFLEWKGMVMDSRRLSSTFGAENNGTSSEDAIATIEEQRERNEELLTALSAYRSMFTGLSESLNDKKDPLRSPGSVSTFTEDNSVSGMSMYDDETESMMSEDRDDDLGDVFGTDREIRRIQNVSIKLDRKIEKYQDAIQQLERNLAATQDELETATAATKYAEFQLEQYRSASNNHADTSHEVDRLRRELRQSREEGRTLREQLKETQRKMDQAKLQLDTINMDFEEVIAHHQKDKNDIQAAFIASVKTFEEHKKAKDEEIKQILSQSGGPIGEQLASALKRIQELEAVVEQSRSSNDKDKQTLDGVHTRTISRLQDENEDLRKRLDELQSRVGTAVDPQETEALVSRLRARQGLAANMFCEM